MMIPRYLRYAFACVAMCFGTFAFASVDPVGYGHTLKQTLASVGDYGTASAKLKVELAHMHQERTSNLLANAGLIRDSHGFLQSSADEVTKGVTGSTVSLSAT